MKMINFLLLILFLYSTGSVSMLGIELYDSRKSVESLKLPVVGEEPAIVKYRTKNGNDFSVTFENDKVVYMENDWLQKPHGTQPLFTDFTFGKTSIGDIRQKYGSNGFVYANRSFSSTDSHLVTFNCYEFDSAKNEVLVTITGLPINERNDVNENNLSEKLLLLAVIIADKGYLDKIWGEEKVYDENYKKLKP